MLRRRPLAACCFALAFLAACGPRPPDRLTLTAARFADLPGWQEDQLAAPLAAFRRSCALIPASAAADAPFGKSVAGNVGDWRAVCDAAAQVADGDDAAARRFFESWFVPWKAGNNGESQGLFTGYYEAELRGSRTADDLYSVPLLRRPPDLVAVELGDFRPDWRGERVAGRVVDGRLKPYDTRAQIEHGALDKQGLAFLWVDDPVDAFFLQIQGSGRVRLPDGSWVRVAYDGQNGWPYVPIGRLLVESGILDRDHVSMQTIRAWIKDNPEAGAELMDENPSYVFFRELAGDGPVGSGGAVLTPGRSLAVDRRFVPLGVPLWLDARDENGRLDRLVIAQDTGGAIRGPVRGDLFWGFGDAAAARAGTMRMRGEYYLFLPRNVAPAAAASQAASGDLPQISGKSPG